MGGLLHLVKGGGDWAGIWILFWRHIMRSIYSNQMHDQFEQQMSSFMLFFFLYLPSSYDDEDADTNLHHTALSLASSTASLLHASLMHVIYVFGCRPWLLSPSSSIKGWVRWRGVTFGYLKYVRANKTQFWQLHKRNLRYVHYVTSRAVHT